MAASLDEARYGFSIDAPFSTSTLFYALLGDNITTNSAFSGDIDLYRFVTSVGTRYSISTADNFFVGNTYLNIYDSSGFLVYRSTDFGPYSNIIFTAVSGLYFIGTFADRPGNYQFRAENVSVTESNGVGQVVTVGSSLALPSKGQNIPHCIALLCGMIWKNAKWNSLQSKPFAFGLVTERNLTMAKISKKLATELGQTAVQAMWKNTLAYRISHPECVDAIKVTTLDTLCNLWLDVFPQETRDYFNNDIEILRNFFTGLD
jgi:hypothetical protein